MSSATDHLSYPHDSMDDVTRQTSSLVGRAVELEELLDVLNRASEGGPGAVVLGGDAGVGKTRLVNELAARAADAGMTVLVGHCVNLPDGMLPYVPFVDAFRRLNSDVWRTLEPHLRGGDRGGEQVGQLQIFEGVVELLAELAVDNPVCLILEDLHWADRPSRELVLYLVNRLRDERVALLLTYRSDDVHRRHPLQPLLAEVTRHPLVSRISLEPLPPAAIESLLRQGARPELSPTDLRDIIDRAEGNAFFAEELLEARFAVNSSDGLPSGLADVLIARLDLLDPTAQRVVGFAAVAGRRIDHDSLAEVSSLPEQELNEALREAVARHILVPTDSGGYQFRHALLQEAAYGDLLPGERVRIHAAYAQLFSSRREESPVSAAEAAYHAEHSHNLGLALSASVHAADYARSVHAPSEAARHLERALQWWCAVPDAAERTGTSEFALQLRAAESASAAGDAQRAVALLRSAAEASDPESDPERFAVVQARLAGELYLSGNDDDALAIIERAVEVAARLPVSTARAMAFAVRANLMLGEHDASAKSAAEEAIADARAAGAVAIEAEALVSLSRVTERDGDADTATGYLTTALELSRSAGDDFAELRTLFNLAMARYDAGDLRGSLHWTEIGMAKAMDTGTTWSQYAREIRAIDVLAHYSVGDWDHCLRRIQIAVDRAPWTARLSLGSLGLYPAVGRGLPDFDDRVRVVLASRHPDRYEDAQIHMLVAGTSIDRATWAGRPTDAVQIWVDEIDYPSASWGPHYMGRIWLDALALAAQADLSVAAAARGDAEASAAARLAGERMVEDARETGKLGVPRGGRIGLEGLAWLARAEAEWSRLLGEDDPVVWEAAVTAFDYGYDYEVARSRWRLAEVLARLGRVPEAAEQISAARAVAERLGAAPLRAALDGLARRAKITGPGSPAPTDSPLTAREQEVLELLAQGRTNRQIGAELFISEKTASVHVSNILGKLAVSSRGEAVAVARGRGLV